MKTKQKEIPKIPRSSILFIRNKLFKYSDVLYDNYRWRKTTNKFHALVVEIMLQRTKADQVLPVYIHFSEKYKTPEEYIKKNKVNLFKTLGLPARHDSLQKLAQYLTDEKDIPLNRSELLKLPGVGEYVASAFLSLHNNKYDILIDSNIVRFYSRFFGFPSSPETRREKWIRELGKKITPRKEFKKFNYSLLDFTRKICKPRNPLCETCLLAPKCEFGLKVKQI
ncbi:MAG: hypothetical protein KDK36_09030 [Leptospiraceae bacterium]|nr:hypothetical protein [Leptospiraceae bacterium]